MLIFIFSKSKLLSIVISSISSLSKDIVFNLGKLFLFTELSSKDFIFISANVNSSNVLDLKESSTFKSSTDNTFNLFKFIFNEFNL